MSELTEKQKERHEFCKKQYEDDQAEHKKLTYEKTIEKPFECSACGGYFETKRMMKEHGQDFHGAA